MATSTWAGARRGRTARRPAWHDHAAPADGGATEVPRPERPPRLGRMSEPTPVDHPVEPSELRLTEWTSCGGCAAKWGGAPLSDLVRDLAGPSDDPSLLVGLAPFDDAAVYRISDDVAIVSTTDFFPPLVDDPADFGAIAAANACSDVFAMGGRVMTGAQHRRLPRALPAHGDRGHLRAAAETVVAEAGGSIVGGPHHPQPGADLRPRRAGPGASGSHLPKGGRRPGRRPRALQAARHGHRPRRRCGGREGGGDRRHARR